MDYTVLGFSEKSHVVLVQKQGEVYTFDMQERKLKNVEIDFMQDDNLYCINSYLIVQKAHHITIYETNDFNIIDSIVSEHLFNGVVDISKDANSMLVLQKESLYLWDIKNKTVLISFSKKNCDFTSARLSNNSQYCIYITPKKELFIFDLIESNHSNILENIENQMNNFHFHFFEKNNQIHLILSGVFLLKDTDEPRKNILVYNVEKQQLELSSNVSPTNRIPTVKQIVTVTDKYIILLACYGFMDTQYRLYFADVNSGKYIDRIDPTGTVGMNSGIEKVFVSENKSSLIALYYHGEPYNDDIIAHIRTELYKEEETVIYNLASYELENK